MRMFSSRFSLLAANKEVKRIPLWLKIAFTAWIMVWTGVYANFYGPQNFLWLCDLCNFILLIALWLESSLLFSSQIIAVLIVDVLWSVDVGMAALTGYHPIGGTQYMFSAKIPLYVRMMSLFHVFTPPLLIYAVFRLGYNRRGLILQSLITWIVLPLSYLLTDPPKDINWVFGPAGQPQSTLSPGIYFFICMLAYPLIVYLPTHGLVLFLLRWQERIRRDK